VFTKSILLKARSSGISLGTAKSALNVFQQLKQGIRTSVFNKIFKPVSGMHTSIAGQQILSWKARIPASLIPQSDFYQETKYMYKFTVPVFDKAQGTWSNEWVSLGSNRILTPDYAWQQFMDNYKDTTPSGLTTFYTKETKFEEASFQGVWKAWEWTR